VLDSGRAMNRRFTPLIVAALLLVLATGFSSDQATPPANPSSLVVTALNAAKDTHRFVFALLHNGPLDVGDASSAFDEVLQDKIIATHVVRVTTSVAEDPDAQKVALTLSFPANPRFPMFVFITPTAQGFSVVGSISGSVTAPMLRIWLVGKMCDALEKNTPGAPPMDSDLASLCSSSSALNWPQVQQPPASNSSSPRRASPASLPLTNAEVDLTNPPNKQTPHLKGTWKGTASRWLCGVPQPPVDVVLALDDNGYRMPSAQLVGNVSGVLTVDGVSQGILAADYGDGRLQTNPLETMFITVANLSLQQPAHVSLSPFSVKFSARDASLAGLGYYQMLSGAMFRSDGSNCPQLGDLAEALKVDLKKQ
jgi:hypothetical protein